MNGKNLRPFCEHHGVRVLDTNKRASKVHKVNVNYFKDPTDFNKVYEHIAYDTEPLWTVEITESELERIADFEAEVFNNMKQHGHYRMFETLIEQKEQEKYLRDKYPAVKKAYEHYSMILKLAQSGEL